METYDGNKIRCVVLYVKSEYYVAQEVENFCKGKRIIDIKYTPVSDNYKTDHYVFISYLIE